MKDIYFQKAVDLETDRLARLNPCELMQIEDYTKVITIDGKDIEVSVMILDLGESRQIGILASRQLSLGTYRKFHQGLSIQLKATRMSAEEAASFYD